MKFLGGAWPKEQSIRFWWRSGSLTLFFPKRGFRGEERQMTVGLSITAIFNVFARCFFGNFRDEASVIIWRYTVRRQLFNDPKMHDLE